MERWKEQGFWSQTHLVTIPAVSLIRCQADFQASVSLCTNPVPGTFLSEINVFDPHHDPMRWVFYRRGICSTEKLSNLPKVGQLRHDRAAGIAVRQSGLETMRTAVL